MRIPQSILDDIQHSTDILRSDVSPNWHAGAAGMLRNIADDIERVVDTEKANLAHEAKRKADELLTRPQP